MQPRFEFGMIGLGVMGSNLLLNIAEQGFASIGFDLNEEKCKELESAAPKGTTLKAVNDISAFVKALNKPKKIMLLVPAGKPVDDVIETLLPHLEIGDIVIDGGNSYYKDTLRRVAYMETKGFHFIGMGISGGESGARLGPSMMPGGDKEAYEYLKPLFEPAAATFDNTPCVAYMGKGAAGHYVKMVHNGIEYAMMQMISEVYDFLKRVNGVTNEQFQDIFERWNRGQLQSYLISITASIFKNKDDKTDKHLIDVILDYAGSKGTGKWTSQESMELPVAVPSIDVAVAVRTISIYKKERVIAAQQYNSDINKIDSNNLMIDDAEEALIFCFIIAYAQGLNMLAKASTVLEMDITLSSVVQVWKAGCIIRSALLADFSRAYEHKPDFENLLLDEEIGNMLQKKEGALRKIICKAIEAKLPMPGFMSALSYFDLYCSEKLPLNLIQAQRDFFGAHTYQRIDGEGIFHTQWEE